MSNNIMSTARTLGIQMAQTPAAALYVASRQSLTSKDIELIKDFKRLENEHRGNVFDYNTEKMISNRYTKLMLNPDIRDFLESEREVCHMLVEVAEAIGQEVNITIFS
ncbi:MAG: YlbF family regulator [Clostridiales bacterium]|nr:YlbF family regulator [Clostridiales bacterium]